MTSDGATITMSIEQSGTGDLTMRFSDGDTTLDCTPADTIALTAGSDASPTENYIYIPQSTKVLTKSTSDWPSAEHIKVGYFLVPSAAFVQSNGCYINQNWNDHRMGTDSQGHLPHMAETIRLTMRGSVWHSGVAGNAAGSEYLEITGTAPSVVEFKSTAGVSYQMHKHTVPAVDMSGGDTCLVVNWNADAYHDVTDLADIVVDSTGASLSNRYFNLVFWGVANKSGEFAPIMCNIPSGSYSTQVGAELDLDNYTVTTIPNEFTGESSTGFLVCRLTVHQNPSGTWTLYATEDLRGTIPGAGTGAAGAGGALTDFPDNQLTIYNVADDTKIIDFDLSGITTGNTRTITPADADMTLLSTTDHTDLTDSGDTTLHGHDVTGLTGWLGPYLPLTAGSSNPLTGNLYIDKANAALYLRHNGATDYTLQSDSALVYAVTKVVDSGQPVIRLDPYPADGTSSALVQMFRTTNTSGTPALAIYLGNNTSTEQHRLEATATGDAVFCRQGGNVTIEEGYLYLDKTSTPTIYLRENGSDTDYSGIYDNTGTMSVRKYISAGQAVVRIDPYPGDNTSTAIAQFFRTTDTSGAAFLAIYQANNTTTESHRLEASGDAEFCKDGLGNVRISEGNLYLSKTSNPTIFLREGGSSTSYTALEDETPTYSKLSKIANTGASYITLDPRPSDGTSGAICRVFRETNTTGSVVFQIMEGDNTNTANHALYGGSGDAKLCMQGGNVTIEEGNLYLNKTANPSVILREGGSTTSYAFFEDTTANNMELTKVVNSGAGIMDLNLIQTDGSSAANIRMFRETSTSGAVALQILQGDGTASANHRIYGNSGNAQFCEIGGYLTVGSATSTLGDIIVDSASDPSIFLRESADSSNYSVLQNTDDVTTVLSHVGAATAQVHLKAIGGAAAASQYFFGYGHSTTGTNAVYLYDDTTLQHSLTMSGDATASLCQTGGTLTTGGDIVAEGDIVNIATTKTPASAGAAGNTGDICWDSGYVYVCVAASTWKRAAIATW
ncbi:MAG: hypothetical protein ACYS7Y_30595 [Planctomycetota bacterium]